MEAELSRLSARKCQIEDLASWETPATAREAYLMMLLAGWRNANAGMEESEAVDRLLEKITLFLEGLSGTTAEELGLGNFIARGDGCVFVKRANEILKRAATPHGEEASL